MGNLDCISKKLDDAENPPAAEAVGGFLFSGFFDVCQGDVAGDTLSASAGGRPQKCVI